MCSLREIRSSLKYTQTNYSFVRTQRGNACLLIKKKWGCFLLCFFTVKNQKMDHKSNDSVFKRIQDPSVSLGKDLERARTFVAMTKRNPFTEFAFLLS